MKQICISHVFIKNNQLYMHDDLKQALDVLHNGGVILYPTDTIWGLGCDATNEKAVQRIYEIKKRAETRSMLILLDSPAKLQAYVEEVPEMAWDLIEVSDKPLTIVYPGARNLAPNLLAEDGTIGIRVTAESFSKKLCERFKKPIVSTSANISGEKTAAVFADISEEIIEAVDYVVKQRQNETGKVKPSSIIKLSVKNEFEIIRQ